MLKKINGLLFMLVLLCAAATFAQEHRIVTDQLGRTVRAPHNPQRIVSLAPSIAEIMYALGQGRRLQGVTQCSDYPPQAAQLPQVGSYARLDLERIVALRPDLCIATKDGNSLEEVTRLQRLGLPVYTVSTFDLRAVMDSIIGIGALVGADSEAQMLVKEMAGRIGRVRAQAGAAKSLPRVFFQVGVSPIVTVGSHTCIHGMIETAGGENIAKGPTPYPRFSREQVIACAPEVIIITSMGGGTAALEARQLWLQWKDIPAVRNNRVHIVDSDIFDRPGPRMVQGIELLAQLLHPELISHDTP